MATADSTREARLVEAFVRLADSLAAGFDAGTLLDELIAACVDLLDVAAAGLLVTDPRGGLSVTSASAELTRLLDRFEFRHRSGPGHDAFATGARVAAESSAERRARWPEFAADMDAAGFGAVYALPLRLREDTVGALTLLCRTGVTLDENAIAVGQALADVATIAALQHRRVRAGEWATEQLQTALTTRVTIEQAKGIIAEHAELDMDRAFARLRRFARSTQQPLSSVAAQVASGRLSAADIVRGATDDAATERA